MLSDTVPPLLPHHDYTPWQNLPEPAGKLECFSARPPLGSLRPKKRFDLLIRTYQSALVSFGVHIDRPGRDEKVQITVQFEVTSPITSLLNSRR